MANTVFKLRRSSVAGKQPNTSTLAIGELALNLTDRKLYSSDGTNVWETGANLTTLTVSTNSSVNNVIFSGGIYANSSLGVSGYTLYSNGSGIYWASPSGGSAAPTAPVRQQYTADGVTDTFTVSGGYEANTLSVYINGVLLRNGTEANVESGTAVVISPAPANGSLIDVVGYAVITATGGLTIGNVEIIGDHITVGNSSVNTQIYAGNVYLNGSTLVIGNTASNVTINSTSVAVSGQVINSTNYQTTAGLSANVATLTANNTTYVNGKTEGNLNVNSALTSNNSSYLGGTIASGYQTTAGLSANVATLAANNTTYVNGKTEGNLNVNNATTVTNGLYTTGNQTITGGFSITPYNLGSPISSFTVTPANGNYQYGTNNGAFTITNPASDCAVDILITNGASAGAITFTGFTAPSGGGGDTYATTNANKYLLMIRRINGTSTYAWKALQ